MTEPHTARLQLLAHQVAPNAVPDFKYLPENAPFDAFRPLKAIIVGAGIAGISSAVLLPRKVPNLSYTVYEKNATVGGTWAENIYPGVRCDVPSHVYQLTFAPNPNWSEFYPKGREIREYYERVVEEFGVVPNLLLKHQVIAAKWAKSLSEWEVEVKNLVTGETVIDRAHFLISAQGRLNHWVFPDYPGLQDRFTGKLVHTSAWDTEYEFREKRIAIIGNGASGQQLLPNILPHVSHIDHYVRSKTWVTPAFAQSLHHATADKPGGPEYTEEQKKAWREDPAAYLEYRKSLEKQFHGRHAGSIKGSPENEAFRQLCLDTMLERLGGDKEWLQKVTPDYAPGCKRPTPAPGYIEALKHKNVEYITDSIVEITETGIKTSDGKHREVDMIIAATGHADGFRPRFPTVGENDVDLAKLWATDGPIGWPKSYFGIMAPGFPNYFFILQAQGNGAGGSIPLQCEISTTYIAKSIRKIQSQSYSSLSPSFEATEDFDEIINNYFEDKVTTDSCNSWFKVAKGNSRNVIHWPGTGHHRFDISRDPRWEDFVFERRNGGAKRNRFEYFGNGSTVRENTGEDGKTVRYLIEAGKEDLAIVHEAWNL